MRLSRFPSFFVFLLLLGTAAAPAARAEVFGKGVHLTPVTPIGEILAAPGNYLGKSVAVEGTVVAVCARRGCWIDLAGEKPGETLRVKVEDGEMVFKLEARGKRARVEGVIEKLEFTREQAIRQGRHHAEEEGVPFDPATVTGPVTLYRIMAVGAEIP